MFPKPAELVSRIVLTGWPDTDLAGVGALCEELGLLPLALEQATSYLAQTRITPTAYLELPAGFPARMSATTAERQGPRDHEPVRVNRWSEQVALSSSFEVVAVAGR